MNKALKLFIIIATALFFQSCQKCNSYIHTDPIIVSCLFQAGSYFVYSDTTDHIIDSEYVYQYTYHINGVVLQQIDNCLTYGDVINMSQNSFHNGTFFDKIYSTNESGPAYLYIYDSLGNDFSVSQAPTFIPFEAPVLSNFSVNGNAYPTVYKDSTGLSILENNDTVPLTLYFAPNYGIVKRVEHRPTGDVSWDLIRYHIVH